VFHVKHSGGRTWSRRALLSSAAQLASATLVSPALPKPETDLGNISLAGQLLVASPNMEDPRFAQSVILMIRHDNGGAMGIIVNRPIGRRPLADLLQAIGQDAAGIIGEVRIFFGGPVQPNLGFIVHSNEYRREGTIDVDGRVAMTSSAEILRDIGHNQGPAKSLIAFGYAGWAAGQLESELAQNGWVTTPEDSTLVFGEDRAKVWGDAMERATHRP
jgi:putative transcriptional regulator